MIRGGRGGGLDSRILFSICLVARAQRCVKIECNVATRMLDLLARDGSVTMDGDLERKRRVEKLSSPRSHGFSLVQNMIDERNDLLDGSRQPRSSECRSIRCWHHVAIEPNSGKVAGSKVTAIWMEIAKRG